MPRADVIVISRDEIDELFHAVDFIDYGECLYPAARHSSSRPPSRGQWRPIYGLTNGFITQALDYFIAHGSS